MDLKNTGYSIFRSFLPAERINVLNKELDRLFDQPTYNGQLGSVYPKSVQSKCKSIFLPTVSIRSTNLLEIAIDISNQIGPLAAHELKLTAIQVHEEIDPIPLFWHTDQRKGTFRCFIYLDGGNKDSGALKYIPNTHQKTHETTHLLSAEELKFYSDQDQVIDLIGSPGDMVVFDINGFHANNPKLKRRRTMMFEFQRPDMIAPKASNILPQFHLSKKVFDHIDLFMHNGDMTVFNHGCDASFLRASALPIKVALKLLLTAIRSELTKDHFIKRLVQLRNSIKLAVAN